MSGHLTPVLTGFHIKTVAGNGSRIMDGLGFPTSLGAGLRITTVAGFIMEARGTGGRVPFMPITILCGRQPMFHSSVSAEGAFRLELVSVQSGGARWGRLIPSSHGSGADSTMISTIAGLGMGIGTTSGATDSGATDSAAP
jgi:hypothetical protein